MQTNVSEKMILGIENRVEIVEKSDFGFYVATKDGSRCLFPNRYITEAMKIGDVIEAFIYTDSEDRMVATTEVPLARLGEFAYLEVKDVTNFGAFVEWGIAKDLLVPRAAQKKPYKVGEKHIIRVSFDEATHRLIGVGKSKPFMSKDTSALRKFMEVKIIIDDKTPMGYKVIADDRFEGMIFHNEIFQEVERGMTFKGYIKEVRADGKLDISLQPLGAAKSDSETQKVLDVLAERGGKVPYTSKSDPKQIEKVFGLSKKAFKRALTSLKEAGKIRVEEEGTYLL